MVRAIFELNLILPHVQKRVQMILSKGIVQGVSFTLDNQSCGSDIMRALLKINMYLLPDIGSFQAIAILAMDFGNNL